MLTQFMTDWYAETVKWADAQVKTACAESPANRQHLSQWTTQWLARGLQAVAPIATHALGEQAAATAMAGLERNFRARVAKVGVEL